MTDEERVLKNIKYIIKQNYVDTEDDIIGILISASNLIKKQSKEIEELKMITKEYDAFLGNEKIIIASKSYFDNGYFKEKFISKDKIKAKIQEYRKILYSFEKELELKANKEKYINKESMNCLLSQISILQSLLEKE